MSNLHALPIIALVTAELRVDRLQSAFGRLLCTCPCQQVVVRTARAGASVVILPPRDASGHPLSATIAALHVWEPALPIYVYSDRSVEAIRALLPLAKAGVTGIIIRDVDDDPPNLRRLLLNTDIVRVVHALSEAVTATIPTPAQSVALYCLGHVTESLDARQMARAFGVSQRTLTNWATRCGARGVRGLISRCRVLVVLGLLEAGTHSIERVAFDLRFGSSSELHNMVRRYTGGSPSAAARKGISFWCDVFLAVNEPSLYGTREVPRKA